MTAEALELDRLTVEFPDRDGRRAVLTDVTLRLAPGERVGLVGESGSGKSLAAMASLGLVPKPGEVTSGSVRVDGAELGSATPAQLRAIRGGVVGLVPQEPASALHPTWRVGFLLDETVRAHSRVDRRQARLRSLELLESVALEDPAGIAAAWAHQLSGGQAQRVALALALAGSPRYLIADEPTTALDLVTQRRVLDLLDAAVSEAGLGLLLISHDTAVVADMVDRLVVLVAGMIVEEGPTGEVLRSPRHPATRELLSMAPASFQLRPTAGAGCPFVDRCPIAESSCRGQRPSLSPVARDHRVRCPVVLRESTR